MQGKVTLVHESGGWAFIQAGQTTYFCRGAEYPPDQIGLKWLAVGEEVEFTPAQPAPGKSHPVALNVKVLSPREEIDAAAYREIGVVKEIAPYKDWAYLTRPNGGTVWLHFKAIESHGKMPGRVEFSIGQPWEYGVKPNDKSPRAAWVCIDAVEMTYDDPACA